MIKISKDRFQRLIVNESFEVKEGSVIKISDVFDVLVSLQCKADRCDNESRYSSGYCSIHDMSLNNSQGKRITHPE
jgi:hypothetical protein